MSGENYESLIAEMGEFGRWQKLMTVLLWLPSAYTGMAFLAYPLAFATPNFRCRVTECEEDHTNFSQPWTGALVPPKDIGDRQCQVFNVSLPDGCDSLAGTNSTVWTSDVSLKYCDEWVYDKSVFESTVVTAYGLVCSRKYLKSAVGSGLVVAYGLGNYFTGLLSDHLGRRSVLLISLFGGITFNVIASFSVSITMHIGCVILSGLFVNGCYYPAATLTVELVGAKYAALTAVLINCLFVCGQLYMIAIGYFFRDYITMLRVAFFSAYLILFIGFIVPESPRWLIAKKRFEDAVKIIKKGAKFNGIQLSEEKLKQLTKAAQSEDDLGEKKYLTTVGYLDLLKSSQMRRMLIIIIINFFAVVLNYNGLTYHSVNLGGNVFLNFAVIASIEIPSYVLTYLTLDRLGRRPTLICCQFLCWMSCFLVLVFPSAHGTWASTALATTAKSGTSAAYGVIILQVIEIFPTSVRSTVMGSSSLISRAGAFLAPIITNLGEDLWFVPWATFLSSSLLAMLAAILVVETAGKELPMTVKEAEDNDDYLKCGSICGRARGEPIEAIELGVRSASTASARQRCGTYTLDNSCEPT